MKLHYIYDPLCGWCYGAAPLIAAAREQLPVVAHGGGMMSGAHRQRVTPSLRDYVVGHDRRIAAMTGQPFGDAYFDGLLNDPDAWFDSTPPIAAVLAAGLLAGRELDMLARLQHAHYVEGRRIAEQSVLLALACELGFDASNFAAALAEVDVTGHLADSRRLLAQCGGQGFPTLLLERNGQLTPVDVGAWLGRVDDWRAWLAQANAPTTAGRADAPFCGLGGCED
ncbi:DsbA family protein [Paludibacterium purpuratum]|uniref:DSBA-like thioredoxin domain-containing protein n=1 Tax=Paludibacterium purpuratum TaxID=1144873 RepID=A0A4R7AYI7_9NEIS|nr:DsbA family protein [Paludibacterium purpuratum]TDR71635.1 putative protein-disulfide isomerase [Paludibacterium purpuratum]